MKISALFTLLYKIFFIGLLLQFFAFNIATFSLGLDQSWMQFVWLWKEILIVILIFTTIFLILIRWQWRQIFATREIVSLKLLFALAVGITIGLNYLIHQLPRSVYALAFKYDFLGFVILFAGFHSSHFVEQETRQKLIQRYGQVLKIVLLLALGRYALTFIKPWVLKLFGYNNFIYEGTAGWQAPAVYYTHINQGLPRSSFLFERPTTRGFYLIAFFPLFYTLFLHKKSVKYTRARRIIYGLNILLTFSRAARWAWIIQLIAIALWKGIQSNSLNKKSDVPPVKGVELGKASSGGLKPEVKAMLTLLPIIAIFWIIGYIGREQIFARQYSNTGHIAMMKQWIEMSIEKPLTWRWAASAGPGSHWNPEKEWFNPENQFLQIFIEFGVIGFLPRFALFLYLNLVWVLPRWLQKNKKSQISSVTSSMDDRIDRGTSEKKADMFPIKGVKSSKSDLGSLSSQLLFAMSLGLVWLSASGMILHSFVDRMVVYPFMLLFGVILYHHRSNQGKIRTSKSSTKE